MKKNNPEHLLPVYAPSALWGKHLEGSVNGVNFRLPTDKTVYVSPAIAKVVEESQHSLLFDPRLVAGYKGQGGCRIG